jgi:exodeoxyribonuclease-3
MKIITWNVNGLRAVERKGEIQNLLKKENPSFIFLQEIKGKKEQFSDFLVNNSLYKQFIIVQKKLVILGRRFG